MIQIEYSNIENGPRCLTFAPAIVRIVQLSTLHDFQPNKVNRLRDDGYTHSKEISNEDHLAWHNLGRRWYLNIPCHDSRSSTSSNNSKAIKLKKLKKLSVLEVWVFNVVDLHFRHSSACIKCKKKPSTCNFTLTARLLPLCLLNRPLLCCHIYLT